MGTFLEKKNNHISAEEMELWKITIRFSYEKCNMIQNTYNVAFY